MPDDGIAVVAVGPFAQLGVPEFLLVPEKGEPVLIPPFALCLAGEGKPCTGLSNLVQADVGQGDVLFQYGAMACPEAQLLAEDQGVVTEAEQVFEARIHGRRSHVLDLVGKVVEGGVAVDLVVCRIEQDLFLIRG